MSDCKIHPHHDHEHGTGCGHTAVKHNGHVDYLHDGHLHHPHAGHVDEHVIEVSAANLESKEIPTSYVPFRNTHLLAIATSWAEVIGAQRIYIGAVAEDSSGYPDCRPEFYAAFSHLIEVGTKPETRIEIVTPIINMRKSEIIRRGVELGAPLHLTWSCYRSNALACGTCDSCALRLRGFREAGLPDPIDYADDSGWRL